MVFEYAAGNTERPCIPLVDLFSSKHQNLMKPPFVIFRKLSCCTVFHLPFRLKMSRWQQWISCIRSPICYRLKNLPATCTDSRFPYIRQYCAEPTYDMSSPGSLFGSSHVLTLFSN